MYETIGQLNKKYNLNYCDRPLTDFEKELFNTKQRPNLKFLDLTDKEILNSLSIYYDPRIRPSNDNIYLAILTKLDKLNDSRGSIRLGIYYWSKDRIKAYEYTKRSCILGDSFAYLNMYSLTGKVECLLYALNLKNIMAINLLVGHYFRIDDHQTGLLYLQYGLYKEIKECFHMLTIYLQHDNTAEFIYISQLKFKNSTLEKRSQELFEYVDHEKVYEVGEVPLLFHEENGDFFLLGDISELVQKYG